MLVIHHGAWNAEGVLTRAKRFYDNNRDRVNTRRRELYEVKTRVK